MLYAKKTNELYEKASTVRDEVSR
eukprot:COSAG02_NODE_18251_length_951_cov_0.820423_1_plen_23_part_10